MNISALKQRFAEVKNSTDYEENTQFIKLLLASNEPDVIAFHYSLLRLRENRDFYLRLRAAFVKRGIAGAAYLVQRMTDEDDVEMKADILHLLGRMRHPAALSLAREAVKNPNAELRDRGCYVLGWMGEEADIALLRDRLLNDTEPKVRRDAATAHDQIKDQVPGSRNKLLRNLKDALENEQDKEVTGWIVVTVQYILKKNFGLKEDIEEGELVGDVVSAKEKCLQALDRLKL